MKKFKFSKLVRDKIVSGIKSVGNVPHYRVLNDTEYIEELVKKLAEESSELTKSPAEDLLPEIADVQEIIDNLLKALKITKITLKIEQARKNKKAGSFKKKEYIDYVEANENSEWFDYYQKNPEKYPEMDK